MKKTFLGIALAGLFIMATFVADLTGNWKGTIKIPGGEESIELTYKLKAEGEKLSGVIESPFGEIPLTDGKINGTDFSFKFDVQGDIRESKGKFYGDSIVIMSEMQGTTMKNTFKRVVVKQ